MSEETKTTTMSALKKHTEMPEMDMPAVSVGFDSLQGWTLMQRVSKALSASTLVPPQFQGNLPNCLIALEMSHRIGASPLMVMQNLYVVHGRPAWSAQFLIASFNQCGRFSAMRFRWQGEEGTDDWGCRAYSMEKDTEEEITGPLITIKTAKKEGWYAKNGSKWQTIPELMLMYRAAAWMVRTHAPEISMGLQTAEEMQDVRPVDATFEISTEDIPSGLNGDSHEAEDDDGAEPDSSEAGEAGDVGTTGSAPISAPKARALRQMAQQNGDDEDCTALVEHVAKVYECGIEELPEEHYPGVKEWVKEGLKPSEVSDREELPFPSKPSESEPAAS